MTKYFCDRCTNEIGKASFVSHFRLTNQDNFVSEVKQVAHIDELCVDCTREVVDFVTDRQHWRRC